MEKTGEWTRDPVSKMGAHALAENTPNTTPKLIRLICQICQRFGEIIEKRLHRASIVREEEYHMPRSNYIRHK